MKKSEKILVGKSEICQFAGFGVGIWKELLNKNFPARYLFGAWRAHAENVEKWMQVATLSAGPQADISREDEFHATVERLRINNG